MSAPRKTDPTTRTGKGFEEARRDRHGEVPSSPPAAARPTGAITKPRICVARIGAAHGTRGEVRLWPFTSEPEAVGAYGPLETADGTMTFDIESLRPGKGFFIVRLGGVTDRNAAERLRNIDLFVPRERLPALLDDEFYHADLIGLTAETVDGAVFGTVSGVHNFGAGDLLEIAPVSGNETILFPFTPAVVPKVDVTGGRIIIDPPAGLLEPAEPEPSSSERAPVEGRTVDG